MNYEQTDILVAGGGIAGMIAAISFAKLGYKVCCVDPAQPAKGDMRSTAFLQPARALFEEVGLWQRLEPHAAPLQIMRIIDAGGTEGAPRIQSEFNAVDISDAPFGWNFPNLLLLETCQKEIAGNKNITFQYGVGVEAVLTRSEGAIVTLSDGRRIEAKLLIAADGRNSAVRRALNIDVTTYRYGQKALAFTVTHTIPHENISTEIHLTGGPFTLVPLPDIDGKPASAVVWMERAAEAARLQSMPEGPFEDAINQRSCGIFGHLTLTSERSIWPIISQYAHQMSAERTALIAEAAHVLPPIGAQGLNTSLGDLRVLFDLAKTAKGDLGSLTMLDAYHRARHAEVRGRLTGIDLLNRASMADAPVMRDIRALGLKTIHGLKPVRRKLMQLGLGMKS